MRTRHRQQGSVKSAGMTFGASRLVEDDISPGPGSYYHRGIDGVAFDQKNVLEEEPRRPTGRPLYETIILGVITVFVALLPLIVTHVPAPDSVIQMKDVVADWCTPSICFVFLIVGVVVATSGMLSGAQAGSSLDQSTDLYITPTCPRHTTIVQRDPLRLWNLLSSGDAVKPTAPQATPPKTAPVGSSIPASYKFPTVSPRGVLYSPKLEARSHPELLNALVKSSSPVAAVPIPYAKAFSEAGFDPEVQKLRAAVPVPYARAFSEAESKPEVHFVPFKGSSPRAANPIPYARAFSEAEPEVHFVPFKGSSPRAANPIPYAKAFPEAGSEPEVHFAPVMSSSPRAAIPVAYAKAYPGARSEPEMHSFPVKNSSPRAAVPNAYTKSFSEAKPEPEVRFVPIKNSSPRDAVPIPFAKPVPDLRSEPEVHLDRAKSSSPRALVPIPYAKALREVTGVVPEAVQAPSPRTASNSNNTSIGQGPDSLSVSLQARPSSRKPLVNTSVVQEPDSFNVRLQGKPSPRKPPVAPTPIVREQHQGAPGVIEVVPVAAPPRQSVVTPVISKPERTTTGELKKSPERKPPSRILVATPTPVPSVTPSSNVPASPHKLRRETVASTDQTRISAERQHSVPASRMSPVVLERKLSAPTRKSREVRVAEVETEADAPKEQKPNINTISDEDVDLRVEDFLRNFRRQMRKQREESLRRYQRGEDDL